MDNTAYDPAVTETGASVAQSPATRVTLSHATRVAEDIRAADSRASGEAGDAAVGWRSRAKRLTAGGVWLVMWIATAIADEVRIRRDTRQLRAMGDHMLKDIGITRAEIGDAVRYGQD